MIKKTVTFEDLDGNMVTEDHYFHLFTRETALMQAGVEGDLGEFLRTTIRNASGSKILEEFEKILARTYGRRTEEGKFELDPEGWERFIRSQGYDALLQDLMSNPSSVAEFVVGLFPKNMADNPRIKEAVKNAEQEIRALQTAELPKPEPDPGEAARDMTREELIAENARLRGLAGG